MSDFRNRKLQKRRNGKSRIKVSRVERTPKRERIQICPELIHFALWQRKLTQHCKKKNYPPTKMIKANQK